jgi:hypothetical protein
MGVGVIEVLFVKLEEGIRLRPPPDSILLVELDPLFQLLKAALTPLEVVQPQLGAEMACP